MAELNIYVDDIGTIIEVDMGEDITAATDMEFHVQKPDGSKITWMPKIAGTQKLRYVTAEGDLNMAGDYRIQPELRLGSWWGHAKTVLFSVKKEHD